jgi:diguanylate cyclase (GGDEF)-like protein
MPSHATSAAAKPLIAQFLQQTALALQHGDIAHGVALSKAALAQAQQQRDLHSEARALLFLARADLMVTHLRRARDTAQRVVALFQRCEDPVREAEALCVLAPALSALGHADEGAEAALIALKLLANSPATAQAQAHNSVGIAYYYAGSFDRASAAFEQAIGLQESQGDWMGAYQPRADQRVMEVTRCFYDRYYHGAFGNLAQLAELRKQQGRAVQAPPNLRVMQGAHLKTQALMGLCDGFEACWQGQLEIAQSHADFAKRVDARDKVSPGVALMELWLRSEIAWARQDWVQAESQCQQMLQLAQSLDHEHLVGIAYLLLAQVLSAQRKDAESLQVLRAQKLREAGLRQAAQLQREERIEWQLQARNSHAARARLEAQAQELAQLAMEDALTGLYNRRYLERMAPTLQRQGPERGLAPAMVFVDVDLFKRINDHYSHQVGDQVLKVLAQILRSFVREGDVPVRLGGDEFVVAFAHVDEAGRSGLPQRIRHAVQTYDWESLGAGLEVSVSVGMACPAPGDDLSAWLHRCDQGMYDAKDSRQQILA